MSTCAEMKDKPKLEITKTSKVVPIDADPSTKYALSDKQEESKEDQGFYSHEGHNEYEEDEAEKMESMWQGRCLSVMESMPALLFILSLVAVAVTLTVWGSIDAGEYVCVCLTEMWLGVTEM